MKSTELVGFVLAAISATWVFLDADRIGVRKGQVSGLGNMGPVGWYIATLLLWLVALPMYLAKRAAFQRANLGLPGRPAGARRGRAIAAIAVTVVLVVPALAGMRVHLGDAVGLDAACARGDMPACYDLGVDTATGDDATPIDLPAAAALFRRACDGGVAQGCYNLGVAYAHGSGVPADPREAATLYTRACDARFMLGCYNEGVVYQRALGVAPDLNKAAVLFEKACDAGVREGCFNLSIALAHGYGVTPNPARAEALRKQACAAGLAMACKKSE